jgi:hypothetical protein
MRKALREKMLRTSRSPPALRSACWMRWSAGSSGAAFWMLSLPRTAPPAALFYASRDRSGDHPGRHLKQFTGILQADAYAGYNRLYLPDRKPEPIMEALCWSHARRKFFVLADIAANARGGKNATPISPIAFEAVKRIDALFDIERDINGMPAEQRLAERKEVSAALVAELEGWMRTERAKLSRHAPVAQAIDYMLKRWGGFVRFLGDGRICYLLDQ